MWCSINLRVSNWKLFLSGADTFGYAGIDDVPNSLSKAVTSMMELLCKRCCGFLKKVIIENWFLGCRQYFVANSEPMLGNYHRRGGIKLTILKE